MEKVTTRAADDQDAFFDFSHKLDQTGRAAPLLDAYEDDGLIVLSAEVPGVTESEIELNLEGDVLTISVEKRGPGEGKRIHFSERSYGQFKRCIQLPFAPDPDSVNADVENGVLVIRFPRVESERTRRIAIGSGTRSETDQGRSAIGSKWDRKSSAEEPLTLTNVAAVPPADLGGVPRPTSPSSK